MINCPIERWFLFSTILREKFYQMAKNVNIYVALCGLLGARDYSLQYVLQRFVQTNFVFHIALEFFLPHFPLVDYLYFNKMMNGFFVYSKCVYFLWRIWVKQVHSCKWMLIWLPIPLKLALSLILRILYKLNAIY